MWNTVSPGFDDVAAVWAVGPSSWFVLGLVLDEDLIGANIGTTAGAVAESRRVQVHR